MFVHWIGWVVVFGCFRRGVSPLLSSLKVGTFWKIGLFWFESFISVGLFGVLSVLSGGGFCEVARTHKWEIHFPCECAKKVYGRDRFSRHWFWTSHYFAKGFWIVSFLGDFFCIVGGGLKGGR